MKEIIFKFLDNKHGDNLKLVYRGPSKNGNVYKLINSSRTSMLIIMPKINNTYPILFTNKTISSIIKWFNIPRKDAEKYYTKWMISKTGYRKPSEMYKSAEEKYNARQFK